MDIKDITILPLTVDDVVDIVVKNHRSGRWLSAYFKVDHKGKTLDIGVKSYGKWIQRATLKDHPMVEYTVSGIEKVSEFRAAVRQCITNLISQVES